MSLINKMLQDLDKRHAADGGGKALAAQLRPVPARKGWRRIMWEVGAGLVVGAGWAIWVLYQISPRSVVTELAFQSQAKKPHAAAVGLQAPTGLQAPQPPVAPTAASPAQPPAPQAVAPQVSAGAVAPAPGVPATPAPVTARSAGAEPIKVDMLKLATEITTPFNERSFGVKPRSERKSASESASAKAVSKGKSAAQALAEAELALMSEAAKSASGVPGAKGAASIDKQMRVATPAERAEAQFRVATALLNQGRVAEAMDAYRTSLQQDAGHAASRQALVGLLLENRRIDDAQQLLQEGLSLYPDRSNYAMLSARILVERADLQGAHELLKMHAGGAVDSADYHAFDAAVLQRLGRHKDAVAGYQAALRLAPKAGLWWMGLAISLQADSRNADALDAFRRARVAGGLSPEVLSFVEQRMKLLQ